MPVQSVVSAVSAPIRQLVDLFAAQLRDVVFPEVDAAVLADHARLLQLSADALQAAEEAAAQARREHAHAHAALKTAAERGLGYARVYAADNEALLEQLDAIELDGGSQRRKLPPKRKTKRVKGKPSNVAELPLDANRAAS